MRDTSPQRLFVTVILGAFYTANFIIAAKKGFCQYPTTN